jgi:hypothetical protein
MINSANGNVPTPRFEGGAQTPFWCSGGQRITHNATKGTVGRIDDTYNQMVPKSDDGSLSGMNLITGL